MLLLPILSLIICFILGNIIVSRLSFKIHQFSKLFFIITLGIVSFTTFNYFISLIFPFNIGIIIAQLLMVFFSMFYIICFKPAFNFIPSIISVYKERTLFVLLIIVGSILIVLFNHHVLLPINGDLYTGESTYGDLPFHLSIISNIAYGQKFPPDNPMYTGKPLVYPYLINFFSAILVYEGWSLRLSIIIPGLILAISLIGLIYDFAFTLTKSSFKSFLTVIFYFFNGGLGFYFFLKDYTFNLTSIIQALSHPTSLKEYSHLFEQNIQWGNFLSRMIVPERSLLFGIPAGIIILRLLFFRGADKHSSIFDLILIAFLISLMPLLHTHTVLAMIAILPIIGLLTLNRQQWKNQIIRYIFVGALAIIFAIPHIPLFLNHISESQGFFKFHLWWMTSDNESPIWFWFKNTYLFIPLSVTILLFPKIANKQIRILQVNALILLVIINIALFSPYNWDNVKFLFWAGLFFAIAAGSVLGHFMQMKNISTRLISFILAITMVLSALLSIYREINVKFVLFSKEATDVGEKLRSLTPKTSVFLTYKIHNSPLSNLSGRSTLMGYPGLLWTQGINYSQREKDINNIYAGSVNAKLLIEKYGIDYIVVESYDPEGMFINRAFFNQYPILLQTQNYTIYKVR